MKISIKNKSIKNMVKIKTSTIFNKFASIFELTFRDTDRMLYNIKFSTRRY